VTELRRASRLPSPPDSTAEEEQRRLAALRRALPIQRLIGNGMDYADAAALHTMAEAGVDWAGAAEALGDATLARAQAALRAGHTRTARSTLRQASSCFRFAQSAIDADTDEKRRLYGRALDGFAAAAILDEPPTERVTIPWQGGSLHGWLAALAGAPVVIIFGGADGWKEEYHLGALHLLERGVGWLLLDGPGQGETRLFGGVHLTEPPEGAFSAAVSWLLARAPRVGIWGNSLGGSFAARTASVDARLSACCVNSGSALPNEAFKRFPRMREKRYAMVGRRDDAFAEALFAGLDLRPEDNRIACPLLQLHGAPDALFTLEEARPIHDAAPSRDKTLVTWDDGDHCLYNHSHEKHCLVADWFADKLLG
jgi:alpha-beta hydrolase superfamily lysophospholipase